MSAIRTVLRNFIRSFKTTTVRKSEDHGPEGFPGAVSKINILLYNAYYA